MRSGHVRYFVPRCPRQVAQGGRFRCKVLRESRCLPLGSKPVCVGIAWTPPARGHS